MDRVALVTGGNRGIGLALCKKLAELEFTVILSARDQVKGTKRVAELEEQGLHAHFCHLDVTNLDSIASAHEYIVKKWERLDILINNAGVLLDPSARFSHPSGLFSENFELFHKTMDVNVYGAFFMCEAFMPLMIQQRYGRIVNLTSSLGRLSTMASGYPAYRISKAGINAVTRMFAHQGQGHNVLVNSIDTGWVRTDMGGSEAPRTVEEGVGSIIWGVNLPDNGPTGKLFKDGEEESW